MNTMWFLYAIMNIYFRVLQRVRDIISLWQLNAEINLAGTDKKLSVPSQPVQIMFQYKSNINIGFLVSIYISSPFSLSAG